MAKEQTKIPGFTEMEDSRIEKLAEAFVKIRDEWQDKGTEMLKAKKKLLEAVKGREKIMEAAKAHPKGKVKVGDALFTITAKDPTLDIKVKLFSEDSEGAGGEAAGERQEAEAAE